MAPLIAQLDPRAVVPPDDPGELAAALLPYLQDRALADAVGARGRDRVVTLNEEAVTGREQLYARAMATSRPV